MLKKYFNVNIEGLDLKTKKLFKLNIQNKFFKKLYNPLTRKAHEALAVFFPGFYAKYVYKKVFDKNLNLKNPQDFNEKIQWLKVYSDMTQWTELADKYKVREYLKQCGFEDNLVKLYGVWDNANEIDFNILPEKFILKTNHGYGKYILVRDKSILNFEYAKAKLNKWVNEKYGLISFEPHYWNIPRKIIAEELLQDISSSQISSSLIDYKFFCINGEPELIQVIYDRLDRNSINEFNNLSYKVVTVDSKWNLLTDMVPDLPVNIRSLTISKPDCFEEMTKVARALSKPFPEVRVDLYVVNGKVYFGEMTFTPGGGKENFTDEYLLDLGKKIDLTKAKRRTKRFII